ncbi:MAG: type I-U CRISPR-associated protein Csx17 [Bryobacteraceae bacterium]|nr:type I-U CRISPR-associated protein Csx17 [Bryobacteraceae bacterium]
MAEVLRCVNFPGIIADSLGGYLEALGLLKVATSKWPRVRGCWRNRSFLLCATELTAADITAFLRAEWQPTPYRRWWKGQKELGPARAKASLADVALLDSHIVSRGGLRNVYNPVFGTGGNVGKRDFAKVAEVCGKLRSHPDAPSWLETTLSNRTDVELPELPSTGTWFVHANKTFNSGSDVAREGQLSPWSWLLAFEGALCLAGGVNRLLSAKTRPYGAFPFVTEPPAPLQPGELGTVRAEFWAPDWDSPASLAEVVSLFRRGLARVGSRAARTPADFAMSALTAGAQAGVRGFHRFSLRQTTSGNTFEAIRETPVLTKQDTGATADLTRIADWLDKLPKDQASSQTRKFAGFQGPVEKALLQLGQAPDEPESWRYLLTSVAETQMRLDRTRGLREKKNLLGGPQYGLRQNVFEKALPKRGPAEHIAATIASVSAGKYSVFHNVYGAEPGTFAFGKERTPSAVWHNGNPNDALCDILERRLVDTGRWPDTENAKTVASSSAATRHLVQQFLNENQLAARVAALLPLTTLIRWIGASAFDGPRGPVQAPTPEYRLQALFRPLLLASPLELGRYTENQLRPNPARARAIVSAIRAGIWRTAIDLAQQSYSAAAIQIVSPPSSLKANGTKIAASLLIPISQNAVREDFLTYWTVNGTNRQEKQQ